MTLMGNLIFNREATVYFLTLTAGSLCLQGPDLHIRILMANTVWTNSASALTLDGLCLIIISWI